MNKKRIIHHYTSSVIDAIKELHEEYDEHLSTMDVKLMNPEDVLKEYLQWEGIIGYTWLIENILLDHEIELMECNDEKE